MRRWLAVGGLAVVVGAVPATALALPGSDSGGGTSPVNCQSTRWTNTMVSAGSSFAPISALTTSITAIFPVTITVNAVVAGQPVAFKVVDRGITPNQTARPGVVDVTPAVRHGIPFGFTWVVPGRSAAIHGHTVTINWRRTTAAGSATLVRADVIVTYHTDICIAPGPRV